MSNLKLNFDHRDAIQDLYCFYECPPIYKIKGDNYFSEDESEKLRSRYEDLYFEIESTEDSSSKKYNGDDFEGKNGSQRHLWEGRSHTDQFDDIPSKIRTIYDNTHRNTETNFQPYLIRGNTSSNEKTVERFSSSINHDGLTTD